MVVAWNLKMSLFRDVWLLLEGLHNISTWYGLILLISVRFLFSPLCDKYTSGSLVVFYCFPSWFLLMLYNECARKTHFHNECLWIKTSFEKVFCCHIVVYGKQFYSLSTIHISGLPYTFEGSKSVLYVNIFFAKTSRGLILMNELILLGTEPPDYGKRTAFTEESHWELQTEVCSCSLFEIFGFLSWSPLINICHFGWVDRVDLYKNCTYCQKSSC